MSNEEILDWLESVRPGWGQQLQATMALDEVINCRGAWALGTACGKCPKCIASRPQDASDIKLGSWDVSLNDDGSLRVLSTERSGRKVLVHSFAGDSVVVTTERLMLDNREVNATRRL